MKNSRTSFVVIVLSIASLVGLADSKLDKCDKPGGAYGINGDMEVLKKVILRNQDAGVTTKTLFISTDRPACKEKRKDFRFAEPVRKDIGNQTTERRPFLFST